MYSNIRGKSTKHLMTRQLPPLAIAFVIAELFYKFKSFALECLVFLVTWFVIDAVFHYVTNALYPTQPSDKRDHAV